MKKIINYSIIICTVTIFVIVLSVFSAASIKLGDADGDGKPINVSDARQVLRFAVKLDTPDNDTIKEASDVDKNGEITVSDARTVLRSAVHLENITAEDYCIYVDSLTPVNSARYVGNEGDSKIGKIGCRNGTAGFTGKKYEHGLEAWVARWNYTAESSWVWNEYDIAGQYKSLTGQLDYCNYSYDGWDYTKYSHSTKLEIIGDGAVLYSVVVDNKASTYPININVDVSGVSILKIYFYDLTPSKVGSSWLLGDLTLHSHGNDDVYEKTNENGIIYTYVTKSADTSSMDNWVKSMQVNERSVCGIEQKGIIVAAKVLETKTVTWDVPKSAVYFGPNQTGTVKIKYSVPSRIKYKVHTHKRNMGFGSSFYFYDGCINTVYTCDCGYRKELMSWEIPLPDLTELTDVQTTQQVIQGLPQIN